jgi:hypothetical protein
VLRDLDDERIARLGVVPRQLSMLIRTADVWHRAGSVFYDKETGAAWLRGQRYSRSDRRELTRRVDLVTTTG